MYSYGRSYIKHKKCVVCGKMFDTQNPTSTTCSPGCSVINKQRYVKKANNLYKMYKKVK